MPRSPQGRRSPGARKPPRADIPAAAGPTDGYTTREVADVLGLPTSRILAWTKSGLLTPERGPKGSYLYSFQDIAVLRTARELLDADVPAKRVTAALEALRAQLPVGRPLSAVQLSTAGARILVRDGERVWEPDSGQLQMDLGPGGAPTAPSTPEAEIDEADPGAVPLPSLPAHAIDGPEADDWYDRALDLEAVSAEQAMAAYRRALDLDPDHPDAHLNLGRLLHEEEKLHEAEAHYRAAAAADPDGGRPQYNLGVVLEDLGRHAEAVGAYRKAIALDDSLATAHFNLSRLYEARGNEAGALSHLAAYKRLLARGESAS